MIGDVPSRKDEVSPVPIDIKTNEVANRGGADKPLRYTNLIFQLNHVDYLSQKHCTR